ncbi:transglycosylase SLT domain-containing protein [Trichocoleus sp. FACHB-591]|uniref:lysozyme n=1 Tax=Trichocoleus sp. FACHB-591 TaxID=2692872 RepID=UPI0018EFB41C|nr:transglycosylase SLT domain-containing protein [Trichocoleus sp. FACHB-591]
MVASALNRWSQALIKAPTTGASADTASQDGLSAGIAASQQMAKTDLGRVMAIADRFRKVGDKFNLPPALLAAIASRESRCGNALDQGFGDGGNAFGIMQIDKRFHDIPIDNDPVSTAHIEQATQILVGFLQQVAANHPTWEDEYLLKGAAAAYNSGVSNIQTKSGMDTGTTGNDYGSDVMARAQFYAAHL